MRQGIYSSIYKFLAKEGRQPSYTVNVFRPKDFAKLSRILGDNFEKRESWSEHAVFLDDKFLHTFPREISKVHYEGAVHDIQVAEAESFVGLGGHFP